MVTFRDLPCVDKYYHLPMEIRHINDQKGHGVFALEAIPKNTIVEVSPVIVYHKDIHGGLKDMSRFPGCSNTHGHILESYAFDFDRKRALYCIAMGYGGMYNHSFKCNMAVNKQYDPIDAVIFISTQDIEAGDELTHCYSVWEDGLPFDPVLEEGVTIDASSGLMRSDNSMGVSSFHDAMSLKHSPGNPFNNILTLGARHDLALEDRLDDRPRLGKWLKSGPPEVE